MHKNAWHCQQSLWCQNGHLSIKTCLTCILYEHVLAVTWWHRPRSMFQWQIAPNHWQIMGVKPIQIHWTLLDISTIGCIPELRGSCLCLQQQMRGEANRVANLPTCPCQYSAAYLGDFSSLIDSRTTFEWSGMKRVKTTMMTTMTMTLLTPPPASRVGESISQMTQPHTALW